MSASGSLPGDDEGKVGGTHESRVALFLAHQGAIRDLKIDVGSEEYWKHMAESIEKPVEEVKEYWFHSTAYLKHFERFNSPRNEDDLKREDEEKKAKKKDEKVEEKEEKGEEKEEEKEEKEEKGEGGDDATK